MIISHNRISILVNELAFPGIPRFVYSQSLYFIDCLVLFSLSSWLPSPSSSFSSPLASQFISANSIELAFPPGTYLGPGS